jgi:hypothetical protein
MQNSTPTGFIYVIQSIATKMIKIGFSVMPEGRVKGLQTGSPDKLKLLGKWPGTMYDEKRIHRFLRQHRKHGEWFEVDFERAAFVIREVTRPWTPLDALQSDLNQAIEAGLSARIGEQVSKDGQTPVLTIQLWNVSRCPDCGSWISGRKCPMC